MTKSEHSIAIKDALLHLEACHRATSKALVKLHKALAAGAAAFPDDLDGDVTTLATAPKPPKE